MKEHFDVGRSWEKGKGSKYRKDVCLRIASGSVVEKGTNYIVFFFFKKQKQKQRKAKCSFYWSQLEMEIGK